MTELSVLQAVRLKGRVGLADLAQTLAPSGVPEAEVRQAVQELTATGLLVGDNMLRISPDGRARLNALLATERAGLDATVMTDVYHRFSAVNQDFKALITDWQLKGGPGGQPNTHDDAEYDAAVLARLDDVHRRVLPLVASGAAELPRLAGYATKLDAALEKVNAGDLAWLTRPLIDSYHTVWFELHEELILAIGLTREDAARAGEGH
ncbi:MarR family transcriptional regulator [Mycobacterium kubicae]|uniref:MarR family transcriptional regulator n=1 Tax=Mycobacterium kubicae TaxID=120959 RepID=UPI00163F5818|nr:MarR family transcriptional regulator [Mycobacterium kubicae]QNI08239.1 MarR family transcriptional regulator [Mycobacterium kubicae]